MASILAAVDRGRQVEPDNAIYDIIHAALLLEDAAELLEDESLSYEVPNHKGEVEVRHPHRLKVKGPAALDEELSVFMASASKPRSRSHAIEMELHRQALLPRPQTLRGHLRMVARSISVLSPTPGYQRQVAITAVSRALEFAEQGKRADAERLLDAVDAIATRSAKQSRCAIELLVAQSVRILELNHRALVYRLLRR